MNACDSGLVCFFWHRVGMFLLCARGIMGIVLLDAFVASCVFMARRGAARRGAGVPPLPEINITGRGRALPEGD